GTLVFFLVMSVMPFSIWLSLVFGRLNLPVERLIEMPVFDSVKNMLTFIKTEAESKTNGASIFLIATTLYSATSLFYHMRKSGEIIYGYNRKKSGWKIRVSAVFFLFITMLLAVLSVLLVAGGVFLFSKLLRGTLATAVNYLWLVCVSFAVVLLFNAYMCPYRVKWTKFAFGSLITAAAWSVALVGFAIYLKIGNTGKLYGALSTVIVFMLWLYVLTVCFVSGVIFNSEKIQEKESKKL
ncbi:MAG: YihY/virulence factor BrkB family protein, partial [Clostridia bacterium]|nr:YihY/virulence factor BrkB family protein [Clostridia bacterium]